MLCEGLGGNLILENSEGKWGAPSQPVLYSYCYYLCSEFWASCSAIWTSFYFASFRFESIRSLRGREGGMISMASRESKVYPRMITRRERSILYLVAEGYKNQEIA